MPKVSSDALLSAKKIALLHVAKKQLGLDDDAYRDILRRFGGVDSAADLDEIGFFHVTKHLTALGFRSTWTKRTFGNRPDMASPAQVTLMRDLWARAYGPDENDMKLNAWLARYHHIGALRFVDANKVSKVIHALKRMAARATGQEQPPKPPQSL